MVGPASLSATTAVTHNERERASLLKRAAEYAAAASAMP